MRHDCRAGSKLRPLDHVWLRGGESAAIRRLPELGDQPYRNCESDPADRPKPTEHGDGGCENVGCSKKARSPGVRTRYLERNQLGPVIHGPPLHTIELSGRQLVRLRPS
jgi:hypothetical protein